MYVLITIQVLYLIICISEAWLEQAVIYLKNPNIQNYHTWNKKEHSRSLVYAASVGFTIAIIAAIYGDLATSLILLPCFFFIRRIGFDFALKAFRGKRISAIEGDGWFDGIARNLYGNKGGYWDVLACIISVGLINYFAK